VINGSKLIKYRGMFYRPIGYVLSSYMYVLYVCSMVLYRGIFYRPICMSYMYVLSSYRVCSIVLYRGMNHDVNMLMKNRYVL
jgi:hypothetical protein